MKTTLLAFALVLTIALAGNATNSSAVAKNMTENAIVSQTNSVPHMKAEKAKKAHHKGYKKNSGTKKTK